MTSRRAWTVEERQEAARHDAAYFAPPLRQLTPVDWQRFDQTPDPTDGYVYSVQQLGDLHGRQVLDYGCGTGWLSTILALRGAQVTGIDISAVAIQAARRLAQAYEVEVDFQVASAYDLPFQAASFDVIIGQAILHHLRDKTGAAQELRRVLRPGGRAVFFEAFGNSRVLEWLRVQLPIAIDEEDRTHWQEQLTYADCALFRLWFTVQVREFQCLSRLDRILHSPHTLAALGRWDVWLLRHVPFLRRYARTIVVTLDKARV